MCHAMAPHRGYIKLAAAMIIGLLGMDEGQYQCGRSAAHYNAKNWVKLG
jgi:hypothetical protein